MYDSMMLQAAHPPVRIYFEGKRMNPPVLPDTDTTKHNGVEVWGVKITRSSPVEVVHIIRLYDLSQITIYPMFQSRLDYDQSLSRDAYAIRAAQRLFDHLETHGEFLTLNDVL